MSFKTKISLSGDKVYQLTGTTITLSGDTVINNNGSLTYNIHPTFNTDTQIIDKKYADDLFLNASGSTVYNLASPSTVTIGGITAGTILTGKTSNEILRDILVQYLVPTFSSFSNNVSTPVEVGCQISGSKSFNWTFTNSSNICASTLCIRDVTSGGTLVSNISTTSPQLATITNKTFTSCGATQVWCGIATNTCGNQFSSSSLTITGLLPYYWGVCTCPGGAGCNRPVASCAMVLSGTKVLASSSSSIAINFNSTSDDYLWFAVPSTVTDKVCWCVSALNNGSIGGGVSPACNLFPAPDSSIPVTTACWSGCNYDVYISNKQTCSTSSMSIS